MFCNRRRLKKALHHPLFHACFLAAAIVAAGVLFHYTVSLPLILRMRGDAVEYARIADGFRSFSDAFSYTGARTYGYPLFLFIIRSIFSPANPDEWAMKTSVVQFSLHILSCLVFYWFFLRRIFAVAKLPSFAATAAAAMLIAWPPMVTYTAIPITDTFATDILMLAIAAFWTAKDTPLRRAILLYLLCGLLFGYSIMVRPVFWPSAIVFAVCNFLVAGKSRIAWAKAGLIVLGLLVVVAPEIKNVHDAKGVYALQDPKFLQHAGEQFWNEGPAAVHIWYPSDGRPVQSDIPSVHDPYLAKAYSDCDIHSWGDLVGCLLSHPASLPFFFAKKAVALFDAPHIEVYAANQTPGWWLPLQRPFGALAFCGFVSLGLMFLARPFAPKSFSWIGLPWTGSALALYGIYSAVAVEERFGFSLVPLSLASLFLAYAAAKGAGTRVFAAWLALMAVAAALFIYQLMVWDSIPPV